MEGCRWVAPCRGDPDGTTAAAAVQNGVASGAAANALSPIEGSQLDAVLQNIFDRYDLDNSGTINSNEELRNMMIYACFKLQNDTWTRFAQQLTRVSDNVDATISQAKMASRLDLSLEEWQRWFRIHVLQVTSSRRPASPQRPRGPDSPGSPAGGAGGDAHPLSPVWNLVRLHALHAKKAYLGTINNVMLNTQPGVTPTALTRQDANLWPEDAAVGCWRLSWRPNPTSFPGRGAHSSLPSSLLEEAFAAIRTLLDEPPTQPHEADLYEALRVYVCGAVVPFLYHIWT
jgi:hypothetical protein